MNNNQDILKKYKKHNKDSNEKSTNQSKDLKSPIKRNKKWKKFSSNKKKSLANCGDSSTNKYHNFEM